MGAVFFDMDGTLIDSRADITATVNHARIDLGLAPVPMEEVLKHVGLGARHLLKNAVPEKADDVEGVWRMFMDRYACHALENVTLYPGVAETLELLSSQGWRLGVNTAKPSFAVHAILEKLGIAQYFGDAVVAGGDCKEMKPSATPLLECARIMGIKTVSPSDWMVGDNWTDVECANNAGVSGAFCEYGFGILRGSVCTARISSIRELPALVGAGRSYSP